MAVASVGTPAQARTTVSGSASVTGTWPTGSTQVAGNLLIAGVMVGGITSCTSLSTPAGWNKVGEAANGTLLFVAYYWRIATGGDAAPSFTSTTAGTTVMTCQLGELTGANSASPVDTFGTTSGTVAGVTVTTSGNVTSPGEYATSTLAERNTVAATATGPPGTGFTTDTSDSATSSRFHVFSDSANSAPAIGATFSETVTWTPTSTTVQDTASMIVVWASAIQLQPRTLISQYGGLF